MEKQKFYLLCTLIEFGDNTSDGHSLYRKLDDAVEAMHREIEECGANFYKFRMKDIDWISDRWAEWHNDDGYGFSVGIDELTPL